MDLKSVIWGKKWSDISLFFTWNLLRNSPNQHPNPQRKPLLQSENFAGKIWRVHIPLLVRNSKLIGDLMKILGNILNTFLFYLFTYIYSVTYSAALYGDCHCSHQSLSHFDNFYTYWKILLQFYDPYISFRFSQKGKDRGTAVPTPGRCLYWHSGDMSHHVWVLQQSNKINMYIWLSLKCKPMGC